MAVVLMLMAASCGQEEGATVRNLDEGEESATGSATGSGSASATGAATGSEAAVECERVGNPEGAAHTVEVKLSEYQIQLSTSETGSGKIHFELTNDGEEPHEMVVVRAGSVADLPRDGDGGFVEDEAPEGTVIGEVEPFPAGETCEGSFELEPAHYLLLCNIVEKEEDGTVESHLEEGMVTDFTVV